MTTCSYSLIFSSYVYYMYIYLTQLSLLGSDVDIEVKNKPVLLASIERYLQIETDLLSLQQEEKGVNNTHDHDNNNNDSNTVTSDSELSDPFQDKRLAIHVDAFKQLSEGFVVYQPLMRRIMGVYDDYIQNQRDMIHYIPVLKVSTLRCICFDTVHKIAYSSHLFYSSTYSFFSHLRTR